MWEWVHITGSLFLRHAFHEFGRCRPYCFRSMYPGGGGYAARRGCVSISILNKSPPSNVSPDRRFLSRKRTHSGLGSFSCFRGSHFARRPAHDPTVPSLGPNQFNPLIHFSLAMSLQTLQDGSKEGRQAHRPTALPRRTWQHGGGHQDKRTDRVLLGEGSRSNTTSCSPHYPRAFT